METLGQGQWEDLRALMVEEEGMWELLQPFWHLEVRQPQNDA